MGSSIALEITVNNVSPMAVFGCPEERIRPLKPKYRCVTTFAPLDDAHVFPGVEYRPVAGSEEIQNRIQEGQSDNREQYSDYQVQREHIGQDLLGRVVVLLPEQHRYQGHSSHADQGSHGRGEVHQREGHRKSADRVRADPGNMADIDAVDHIIQRSSGLGYDTRDRIHLKEFSDLFRSELRRSG